VAVSDKPYGPFKPESKPIAGIGGIDPNIFVDKDGQAYIITAMGGFSIAKLKDNMLEIVDKPKALEGFPSKGLREGLHVRKKRNLLHDLSHVQNKTEQLEYAVSNNLWGHLR